MNNNKMSLKAKQIACTHVENDDRENYMQQFNNEIKEYNRTHSETSANKLNRHLSFISSQINLKQFDPGSVEACNFYVNLHRLMNNLDSRSGLIWSAIAVLSNASKNSTARDDFINKFKFVSVLSKFLTSLQNQEKIIRILCLMQDLTYGIKITWQENYLADLVQYLVDNINTSENDNIIKLSLSILINLCYKNLPTLYLLLRNINTINFTNKIKSYGILACKMYLILENNNDEITRQDLYQFIKYTFMEIEKSYKKYDIVLLRHIVDFFIDTKKQKKAEFLFKEYSNYYIDIDSLMKIIEQPFYINFNNSAGDEELRKNEPICISLVFELIISVISFDSSLKGLYPRLTDLSMRWLQNEQSCSKSMELLRTIVFNVDNLEQMNHILENVAQNIPILLMITERIEMPSEQLKSLLQLFCVMINKKKMQSRLLTLIKDNFFDNIFKRIFDDNPKIVENNYAKLTTNDISMYLQGLLLLVELNKIVPLMWEKKLNVLFNNQLVHTVIARGVLSDVPELCDIVFNLAKVNEFPTSDISNIIVKQGPLFLANRMTDNTPYDNFLIDNFKSTSINKTLQERLDLLINKLFDAKNNNEIGNVAMSEIMELYEYKLTMCNNAEKDLLTRLDVTNAQLTNFTHRIALLTAEVNKYQSMNYSLQLNQDRIKEDINAKEKLITEIQSKITELTQKAINDKKLHSKLIKENNELKNESEKTNTALYNINKDMLLQKKEYKNLQEINIELYGKNEEIRNLLHKYEETNKQCNLLLDERDKENLLLLKQMEELKQENSTYQNTIKQNELKLLERDEKIEAYQFELNEVDQLRHHIVNLMTNKNNLKTN